MTPRVAVVGGGIGGMALAAALHRLGLGCDVYEQAPELRAVGYGLTLQRNAIAALDAVGLGQSVRAHGVLVDTGQIRQPLGRVLGKATVDLCAVHRATLLSALAAEVPPAAVHLGIRVETWPEADIDVGADGLHSTWRGRVAPGEGPARDSGYTAWRGLAARTSDIDRALEPGVVSESWGRGVRFGIVPIDGARVYWFAVASVDPLADRRAAREFLIRTFGHWHAPVGALLHETPAEVILESRVVDRLPIPAWHDRRLILLGDAAHPMTPNLGQGGCQAIEDAVVLAYLLRAAADGRLSMDEVGSRFESLRRRRVQSIVDQSFAMGRIAKHANPLIVAARDLLFRMIPPRVQEQRLARIVTFPGVPALQDAPGPGA